MNQNNTAIGNSRAEHVGMIMQSNSLWNSYSTLHESQFESDGMKKIALINSEGKVIANSTSIAAAVKHELYTNSSSLRHEDFLEIQDMITDVRQRKLNGIQDLMDAGLTFPVALGDQIVGTEAVNEFQPAKQEMNPNSYDNNNTVYTEIFTPNPITHNTFSVPWRQGGFSYKTSGGLKASMRQVLETLEETLFNGNPDISVSFGGAAQGIHGYTTHPSRGTLTISDWSLVANNDLIVDEVIEAIGKMFAEQGGVDKNSVIMYFPKNFKSAMDRDYISDQVSSTVRERLLKITEIKDVKYGEKLTDSNVIFVELSERTVQLAVASDVVAIPHVKTNPMQSQEITTYAAMVQILKTDQKGNMGLLHASV